jgi:glycosyltransferase involved in cell wall biosynthesis
MPGDGTKLGTTTHNPPPARLLDLTRLMRRAGKVLTGVDRVEAAYLRAMLHDDVPLFGLIRSRLGYILLDRAGLDALCPVLTGNPADVRQDQIWQLARRRAIARVPPILLTRMLRRALPRRVAYVNVGHSNLTQRVLGALRAVNAHIAVMIHDVIPLEFPDYQRDGTVPAFAAMIARVGAAADLVIYNSNDTKRKAEAQWRVPPASIVSHLGTKATSPAPDEIPKNAPMRPPFFICIGTIEPRKNHAFLLDLWAEMGPDAPGLIIAGGRGWKNEAVFARLDALPADGPVREVAGLSDGALAALMDQCAGALFATHAEGFGMPAAEAVARGVPVIANDLPVLREILGDIPIYASVTDRYLWRKSIKELADGWPNAPKQTPFTPATWDAHFKTVLRLT